MATKVSVCNKCKQNISSEEKTTINKITYCKKCAEIVIKEKEELIKLNDYLYNLCQKKQEIMPFLTTQVKFLREKHFFTPIGILNTLRYVYELSDFPPQFNFSAGIDYLVKKYYYEANLYYKQVERLSKQSTEKIDDALETDTDHICINKQIFVSQQENYIEKQKDLIYGPAIDLNDIEDDQISLEQKEEQKEEQNVVLIDKDDLTLMGGDW